MEAGWPHGTTAKDVTIAADSGDPHAIALLENAGKMLGRTVATLVDLLNPQVVVLGSLFVRARRHLEPALLRELQAEALPEFAAACRVVPAELGGMIGDLQALAAALEPTTVIRSTP